MPRKKRTRGGKPKIAVKRKEEDDQSDVSMCSTTSEVPFSKEEVMARLIEDFKFGFENKISHLKALMNKAITDQKNLLKMELLKIPKDIRKMKVSEFVNAGGDMNELVMNVISPVEQPPFSFASNENDNEIEQISNTVKRAKSTRNTRTAKRPIVTQTTGRMTRGAKIRATAAIADMVTPAKGIPQYPIITPKVPPSMCATASRNPKRGEMMFSLAGSPISVVSQNKDLINFALKDGKSSFDVSGAILDMSPNSLAAHTEKLLKFKDFVDSQIKNIKNSTGYIATVKKPKGKSK